VESCRHSLDSQVSVQIAEMTATRKAAATPMPTVAATTVSGGRGRKPRNRRHRREFGHSRNSRVGPLFVRRGSTTSQESQLGAQVGHLRLRFIQDRICICVCVHTNNYSCT
jgi:hypothetical protein